jgi:adenylate cyclase, class 2
MEKEIEIRFKIDADAVRDALRALGWEPTETNQLDRYFCASAYVKEGRTRESPFVVRIRESTSNSLAYKSFSGANGAWVELETGVSNAAVTAQILEKLDLAEYLVIRKRRQSARIGNIEANVDAIDGLGDFLELELISANEEEARAELFRFAEGLGLSAEQAVTKGYVQLMEAK